MPLTKNSDKLRYVIALAITAAAMSLIYFSLGANKPFLVSLTAIMLICWRFGRGPGNVAAIFFVLFTIFHMFFTGPKSSNFDFWQNVERELMFVGLTALVIAISGAQRKAEAKVREQAEWLHFALANISNGVIGADAQGRITYINPMAQRLTGYGEEAIGRPCSDVFKIVSLATKAELENPISKALRENVQARFDDAAILISRDGRRYIVEDSAMALASQEGSPSNAVLVFRDVTEQRRVETELRGAADRFRLALEVGRLVPWEWRISSDEFISEGLSGLLPGVLVPTRDAFLELIHPDDRASVRDLIFSTPNATKTYVVQYRLLKKDSDPIWIESHAQPFYNERGEPVKLLGVLRDMTEQKLVEKIVRDGQEQFRNVAESAADGFVTVDEKFKILYANGSFAALFGYQRSELIGVALSALIPQRLHEDDKHIGFEFIESPRKNADRRNMEFIGLRKDGSETSIEMSYSETRAGNRRIFSAIVRDVSQRNKDAAAMLAARQRLELAQRIAGLGTFQWDFKGTDSYISAELASMFGLSTGEFACGYESWEKIVHPDDLEMVRQNARVMAQVDLPDYSSVYRVIWPDKSVHWMASRTKMFRTPEGEPLSALGVVIDITNQKQAEVERERMLSDAMAARVRMELAHRIAGIGTFEWIADTGQTLFSPELEELYGLQPGEFKQTYADWMAMVHPEDRARVIKNSQQTLESGSNDYTIEFRVIWPDGSVHWITTKGKLYRDSAGKAIRMVGVEQDVTGRKTAETEREKLLFSEKRARERLELAQRAAGIGIFERDLKTNIIQCSPELLKLIGLPTDDLFYPYEDWLERVHPDDRNNISGGISAAGTTNKDYYIEYRVIRADGKLRWLASSGKVMCDAAGAPEFSIGATVDITDRKAADAQRERIIDHEKAARSEAERASQLKDEFLATVSHELRTPLTAIIGWSQMLNEGSLDREMMRRGLDSIERNGRAQAQLVEDLLDVSRIVTGQMRIQMQPLDLGELVNAVVDGVRPAAQAKKVSLNLKLAPARVSGDSDRLHQVVFNILFNAVKFSNLGGRVDVRVETHDRIAQLIVSDNGKGIDPAFLPKLFQRFTQEDASSTRRYGGMGLGLAIARHLVELHGGVIYAESEGEGKGATITVELPILRSGDSVVFRRELPQTAAFGRP